MKAWLLPKLGTIEALALTEVVDPAARAGHVVLDVRLAALNPADRYLAEGQYPARPAMPHVLGRDGVGVVRSIGEGVVGIEVGQTVMIQRGAAGVEEWGTLAEQVSVPADAVAVVPQPARGLVPGASGGVGVAAIHLGKALGHQVAALSRGTGKREELLKLGADVVLDANDTQWRKTLAKEWPGKVDLAIDLIGGAQFGDLIASLADNGRVSLVGRLAGPVPQFNTATLFFRRLQLRGVAISHYTAADTQAAWREIVRLMKQINARPLVDRVFDFADVPAAFARLQEGPMGKVLVRVSGA
jgi:NADPH2:quinone reductase